jgi:predicted DNA-binding transcriptional regulator AlpA
MTTRQLDVQRLLAPVRLSQADGPEFVTADEFAGILKISKRTLFRLRSRGDLPAPVSIATNIIRWRICDVRMYLDGLQVRKPRRLIRTV